MSLDLALTRMAAEALGSRRGSVVVLDPASGAVRVALSDAATFAGGGTPAFDQQREPASIQKLVTTAAALRAGLDPDAEIAKMTCNGSQRYGSGTLWCSFPAGPLHGLAHALAVSCNIAFANLGVRIGREAVVAELKRFGFDGGPGMGHVKQPAGDERQLADLSVGLEATEITPLHAARMAAVFAAGAMPEPSLVAASDGAMGMTPRPVATTAAPRAVVDPKWLPLIRKAMEAVTGPGGTADGMAPPDFPVAMKTGTAEEPGQGYHVNYIGIGPLPEPTLAFCLRVTHQPSSRAVNETAREALRGLLSGFGAAHAPR
jgi:peptidoglycan glycosyltransferase